MAGSAKRKKQYSYAEYLTWENDQRCEIVDGDVFAMNSPGSSHQRIVREISTQLALFFTGKECEVFCAPLDVIFCGAARADSEIKTVVQPDIMVVCDRAKIEERGIIGSPDLIVEVSSPSTASHDNIRKRALYEREGVHEFWIVSPVDRLVRVYKLGSAGRFNVEEVFDDEAVIKVERFPGLSIDLKKVFPARPPVYKVKAPVEDYS